MHRKNYPQMRDWLDTTIVKVVLCFHRPLACLSSLWGPLGVLNFAVSALFLHRGVPLSVVYAGNRAEVVP